MENLNSKYVSELQRMISAIENQVFLEKSKDVDLKYRLYSHFLGILDKINYESLTNEESHEINRLTDERLDLMEYERILWDY